MLSSFMKNWYRLDESIMIIVLFNFEYIWHNCHESIRFRITQFQLMKQTKVKSFIKLIDKIHQITKQEAHKLIKNHELSTKFEKLSREKQDCSITVNFIDGKEKKQANNFQRSGMNIFDDGCSVGIYFTEEAIKHRYDDKKSLYDVYRDSLQKKKKTHQTFNHNKSKHEDFRRTQDELEHAHELNFPINRNNKLKQRRQSYTYQKILRKKSVLLSNRSISILPEQSQRKMKMKKLQTQPEQVIEQELKKDDNQQMREKKMNYKPIFRIKKMALENYKTQQSHSNPDSTTKIIKNPLSKRCPNLKTQPIEKDDKFFSFRQRLRSNKERSKKLLSVNQIFSAWEHQKYEQNQLAKIMQ